jgi:hypothetical protein
LGTAVAWGDPAVMYPVQGELVTLASLSVDTPPLVRVCLAVNYRHVYTVMRLGHRTMQRGGASWDAPAPTFWVMPETNMLVG